MHEPDRMQAAASYCRHSNTGGANAEPTRAAASAIAANAAAMFANAAPVPRRWRPVPFIAISVALHAACLLAALLWPAHIGSIFSFGQGLALGLCILII